MQRTVCFLLIATSLMAIAGGCDSQPPVQQLAPEVAKERQDAYESKMRDGPPRGGKSGSAKK
jgi:hypothetical protein